MIIILRNNNHFVHKFKDFAFDCDVL